MRLPFILAAALLAAMPLHAKSRAGRLIDRLASAGDDQKPAILRALGRAGKRKAVEPILEVLDFREGDPRVTAAAVEALGKLGDARATDALIAGWEYLSDLRYRLGGLPPHLAGLKAATVEALGAAGDEKALPILRRAAKAEDPAVRRKGVEALGRRKDKASVEPLLELLASPDRDTAQSAFEALGEIGDEKALEPLRRAGGSEDPLVRIQADYAIAMLGDTGGALRLESALEGQAADAKAKLLAAYYLLRLDITAGLDHLVRLLLDEKSRSRALAVAALGRAGDKRAVLPLTEALEENDPALRLLIVRALGQLGGPRALVALRRSSNDDDPAVRAAARLELADVGE